MTIVYKQVSPDDDIVLKFSGSAPTCGVYRNSQEVQDWLFTGNQILNLFEPPSPSLAESEEPVETNPLEWR